MTAVRLALPLLRDGGGLVLPCIVRHRSDRPSSEARGKVSSHNGLEWMETAAAAGVCVCVCACVRVCRLQKCVVLLAGL